MNNIFPLFSLTELPVYLQLVPALAIGFLFGFVLERAGFGNARVLAAQFYFYNMRVFKVMFGAIITAGVGLALFSSLGLLQLELLAFPETFVVPHLVGGALLGVGFIVSGYCPGTSIVAAASGKLDGVLTIVGVILGSVLFGELYPLLEGFYLSTPKGVFTLYQLLDVPYAVTVAGLAVMAIFMFVGAEKLEQKFGRKLREGDRPRTLYPRTALYAVASIAVVAMVMFWAIPKGSEGQPHRTPGTVSPMELGRTLIERPGSIYLVDLRQKPACAGRDRIPGAMCYDDLRGELGNLSASRSLILYGEAADPTIPKDAYRFPGAIALLDGGLKQWKATIVEKPDQRAEQIIKEQGRDSYEMLSALHAYYTGAKVAARASSKPPTIIRRRPRKKGGGCL